MRSRVAFQVPERNGKSGHPQSADDQLGVDPARTGSRRCTDAIEKARSLLGGGNE